MDSIYQLHISLKHVTPAVWRRVLVPSSILLGDLHQVVQTVMGWEGRHLHQFFVQGEYFAPPEDDDWDGLPTEDYEGMPLASLLYEEGQHIMYEYDFHDCWEHRLLLEKVIPFEKEQHYPWCVEGGGSDLIENCGGPFGYMMLVEALGDALHPKHQWALTMSQGVNGVHPFADSYGKINESLGRYSIDA